MCLLSSNVTSFSDIDDMFMAALSWASNTLCRNNLLVVFEFKTIVYQNLTPNRYQFGKTFNCTLGLGHNMMSRYGW